MSKTPQTKDASIQEIDILTLFKALIKKWYIIAAAAVGIALILAAYTLVTGESKYVSKASAYLLNKADMTTAITTGELSSSATIAGDFVEMVTSNDVLKETVKKLELNMSAAELKKNLTVTNASGTRIVNIQVSDKNAERAQKIVQAILETADEKAASISPTLHVQIMDNPTLPASLTRPGIRNSLVRGFMIGFVAACVYIVLKWLIKRPVLDERDAKIYFGSTVLGSIPADKF